MKISHEMLKTLQRFTTVGVFIFVGFFCVSNCVFADSILYQQYLLEASTTPLSNGTQHFQGLGGGLTGELTGVTAAIKTTSDSNVRVIFGLYRCAVPQNNVTGCTAVVTPVYLNGGSAYFVTGGSARLVDYSFSSPYTLLPDYYYVLSYQSYNDTDANDRVSMWGSSASAWSGGACEIGSGGGSCTISDLYFILYGTQTVRSNAYTYNLQPGFGSTTPTTYVAYSFQYNAPVALNIDHWQLDFVDVSISSTTPFTIVGSPGSISGTSGLISGDSYFSPGMYTMMAYICTPVSSGPNLCYGPSDGVGSLFTVEVTEMELGSLGQYVFGADANASSTVCTNKNLLIKYPCMAFYVAGAFLFKPSSSTLNALAAGWNVLENYRAPIGYVGQIKSLMDNLSTTTSTSTAFQYIVSLASSSPKVAGVISMYKLILSCVIWFAGLWGGVKLATNFM